MKIPASLLFVATALGLAPARHRPEPQQAEEGKGARGQVPNAGKRVNENKATPPERIKMMKDFKIELLYSVPIETQGSWVNLCVDDKGRLIASDQYGYLYRFAPPPPGQPLDPASVQKIPRAHQGGKRPALGV